MRERCIAAALAIIEARFGPGVVRRLVAGRAGVASPAVPSGSLGLDRAIGPLGGLPRGHVTEFLGADSSGKTALLYAALAMTQRQGGLCALVDAEASADPEALAACGVDLAELIVARPSTVADALLMLTILARCRGLDLLGLASVAALRDLPLEGRAGGGWREQRRYDLPRAFARGLRVLTAALAGGPTAVVLTNETLPAVPGYRTPGGLALRHFAALRIAVEPRVPPPRAAGWPPAAPVALTIVKHKLGVPGGTATVDLIAGRGVDWAGELLALGLATGAIAREPGALRHGEATLGPDERGARRRLARDPALAAAIREAVLAAPRRSPAA